MKSRHSIFIMIKKTNAFLLVNYPYKISSVISYFLTEGDIISTFSYGAKKESSKFGSDLESVSKLNIIYNANQTNNINTLKETSIIKNYSDIERNNYTLFALSYIKEIIYNVAKDYDERYFFMFESILDVLSKNISINRDDDKKMILYIKLLLRAFEIKTLHIAGVSPNISSCINCGLRDDYEYVFSIEDFSIICRKCITTLTNKNDVYYMTSDLINFFKIIKHKSFSDILEYDAIRYTDIINGISKEILSKLLYNHTNKLLKTRAILEDILD